MYTYPLYAMVAMPKSVLLGQCQQSPGYVSDQEVDALAAMAGLRQEIKMAKKNASRLDGLLSSQGAVQQVLTRLARLRQSHRSCHNRFLLANQRKHEALGH